MPETGDNRGGRYSKPTPSGASNSSGSASHYSGSNFDFIYNYLKSTGLFSKPGIAGVMGNLHVESNFNPGAYNPNEGAVGIAQWEGGRRYALQAFAAKHGTSEWDLKTQLDFLVHELYGMPNLGNSLSSPYISASQAAALWDQEFERSAGTTRGARESAAASYFSNNFSDPGTSGSYRGNSGPTYTADGTGGGGSSSEGGGGGGGGGDGTQYDGAVPGFTGRVLEAIPSLRNILNDARANNWSAEKFVNEVENSAWYRQHGSDARAAIASQISDPATWKNNLNQVTFQIRQLAGQSGFALTNGEAQNIAITALMTGNDNNNAWLTYQIANRQNYSDLKNTDSLTGQMAGTVQQLRQIAGDYGIDPVAKWVARSAQNVIEGRTTIDTYRQLYMDRAKSMFPGLADQIDHGVTVADAAQPYIQSMSNLLEVDPSSLSTFTPLIRKALQGSPDPSNKSSIPQLAPVWQFEQQVRQDPRWQYTQNAHQQASTMLMQLGQNWGFA